MNKLLEKRVLVDQTTKDTSICSAASASSVLAEPKLRIHDRSSASSDCHLIQLSNTYSLVVAQSTERRRRGHDLAHRIYQDRGYASMDGESPVPCSFDTAPESFQLIAEDQNGYVVATVTLVYDSSQGMPCDKIFATELREVRKQKRKLVEITRLALDPTQGQSRMLLVALFNMIYLHARHIKKFDEFLIEVNPRHQTYYQRLLGFVPMGAVRSCPRVQGAPAVLLRLNLSHPEQAIKRVAGQGSKSKDRSLYPYFWPTQKESRLINALKRNSKGSAPFPLENGTKREIEA